MITCRQCHTIHTPFNADIRFIKCVCGNIIDKDGAKSSLKVNSITDATPSFFKLGQKGKYASRKFEIVGCFKVWCEESILCYWTLLFEDNTTQLLEEGYGNYALLTRATGVKLQLSSKISYPPNAHIDLGNVVRLSVDINSDVVYVALEGQTIVNTIDPDRVIYCSSIYDGHLYELWNDEQYQDVFLLSGIEFEDLDIEGVIDDELVFPVTHTAVCEQCKTSFPTPYFPYVQTVACPNCKDISVFNIHRNRWEHIFRSDIVKERNEQQELPIGAKAKLLGESFEVIGKVCKKNTQGYHWLEYHLYNAYEGSFAYLSESEGHFILLYELFDPPNFTENYNDDVRFYNRKFRYYDGYTARIMSIEGNLVGAYGNPQAQVKAFDYVAAPYMLSLELGADNANYWHFGEYVPKSEMQLIFNQVQKKRPTRKGYGAARPANKLSLSAILLVTAIMALLYLGIQVWMEGQNESYVIAQSNNIVDTATQQITVDNIQIKEDRTNIDIASVAAVTNDWLVLNYTLINKNTGREINGGQEIAYYQGYEDGEHWSEGSQQNGYQFSGVDKGQYKLVAEVEHNSERKNESVPLTLRLSTTGQLGKNFWFPFFLIIGWAIFAIIKYFAVESYRFSQ